MTISVLMLTKNCRELSKESIASLGGLPYELLVADQNSTDGTGVALKKLGAKIFLTDDENFGRKKQFLVEKATGDWILILDSDERISDELKNEIQQLLAHNTSGKQSVNGYNILHQKYVFGTPVYFGGESYANIRLFRRGKGRVTQKALHEEVIVDDNVGQLKGKLLHHSYRTPWQLLRKFTRYAWTAALEKHKEGERVTFNKLILYGPHMFWARFLKERGYRDGLYGLILALAFAYMEGLQYWMLCIVSLYSITPHEANKNSGKI